ncbi:MAG: hypothetical protein K8U03_18105 [Planctomycetia bacterium]|nr:hypothetical protein [Planctomycetia bacterium]
MLRTVIGFTIGLVLLTTGCADFQELSIEQRNRNAAYCAWKRVRWEYQQQGVPYRIREHVGRGFQQGYYDVSMGSSGQIPLFPPNDYWGVKYQSAEGSAYIGAWFRGYQDGAIAAEKDGLASFNQIPSSWAPPATPSDPTGALTRGEFDGDEIVPAVPTIPPTNGPPLTVPMQPGPNELPPLLQPEMPATPPSLPLPVLPLPTAPSPTVPGPVVPNPTTPAPTGTPGTMKLPPPPGATTTPTLNPATPVPSGTRPATTPAIPAPVPTPTKPRDPIGGRQTLFFPEVSDVPSAQLSLFGRPVEPSAPEAAR